MVWLGGIVIVIKCCDSVEDSIIFETFRESFSDYIIKVDMTYEYFIQRFFGIEGNVRELSFIAFDEEGAVGVLLSGYKAGEEAKTLRCGGMGVVPRARRKGVAKELMSKHIDKAKELGCKQVFLEVIDSNDRAKVLYESLGYIPVYNLNYKIINKDSVAHVADSDRVEDIDYDALKSLRNRYIHMPVQSDFSYFKELDTSYYGIKEDGKLVAGVAYFMNTLYYIWVHEEYRMKGYGNALIKHIFNCHGIDKLKVTFANNHSLHTYTKHLGAEDMGIGQYEMYKWLG